jgi:hypothetical protein
LRIGANYAITSMGDIVALQSDGQSVAQQPQTKPHSNELITPTLKPLPVDRAPALRGAGLFAVAVGAWGLGAVTPRTEVIGMDITHTHYGSFTNNFSIWDNTNLHYLQLHKK